MSGNVQRINNNLTVASTCPIVLNSADAILSYATAESISRNSQVGAGFRVCAPNLYSLNQVYTTAGAGGCCGFNTHPSVNVQTNVNMMGYY